jgi:hypothetical protein
MANAEDNTEDQPLTGWAKGMSVVLIVAGIVIIAAILALGATQKRVEESTRPYPTSGDPGLVATKLSVSDSPPSDAVQLGVATLGVVVVLAGALYGRIQGIKFPGGGEMTLAPLRRTALKAVEAAAKSKKKTPTRIELAAATNATAAEVLRLRETLRANPYANKGLLGGLTEEQKRLLLHGDAPQELVEQVAQTVLDEVAPTEKA